MKLNKKGYVDTGYVKYLTVEEFKKILEYIEKRIKSASMRMILKLIMFLGLRVGEAVSLKRDQFNKNFSVLTLELEKSHKIKDRKIPAILQSQLKDFYNRFNKRMVRHDIKIKKSRYLFFACYRNQSKNKHLQISSVELKVNQICKDLGLDQVYYKTRSGGNLHRITPHTFRHFAIWRYYEAGGKDIKKAQDIIGHKDPRTTLNYINALASANDEQEIIEKAYAFT